MTSEGPYGPDRYVGQHGYRPEDEDDAPPPRRAAEQPGPPAGSPPQARAAVRVPGLRAEPPDPGAPPPQRGQVYGRPSPTTYGSPPGGEQEQQPNVYGGQRQAGPNPYNPQPAAYPVPHEPVVRGDDVVESGRGGGVYGRPYGGEQQYASPGEQPYGSGPAESQYGGGPAEQQYGGHGQPYGEQPGDPGPPARPGGVARVAVPGQRGPAAPWGEEQPAQPTPRQPGVYGRPVEPPQPGPQPLYGGAPMPPGSVSPPAGPAGGGYSPDSGYPPGGGYSPEPGYPPEHGRAEFGARPESPRVGGARPAPAWQEQLGYQPPAPPEQAEGVRIPTGPPGGRPGGPGMSGPGMSGPGMSGPGMGGAGGPGLGGPGGMAGPGTRPDAPPRPPGASWVDENMPSAGPGVSPGMPFGEPRPEPRKGGGLKVFAWIALAVLIVGAGAFALWWSGHTSAPTYTVGSCVQKSGDGAVEVSCGTPNAYKIVLKVSDHSACPDQDNPYITLTGDTPSVYCLAPAQGGTPTGNPSGGASTPAGGATPSASSS